MIVSCAYCGGLPLIDLENLGQAAWPKHVAEHHPDWKDILKFWNDLLGTRYGEQCDGYGIHRIGSTGGSEDAHIGV